MKTPTLRNTLLALTALAVLPFSVAEARPDHRSDGAWDSGPRIEIIGDGAEYRWGKGKHRPTLWVRDLNAPLALRVAGTEYLFYKGRFYIARGHRLRPVDAPVWVRSRHDGGHRRDHDRPAFVMVPVR